jgi:hypothetical protein
VENEKHKTTDSKSADVQSLDNLSPQTAADLFCQKPSIKKAGAGRRMELRPDKPAHSTKPNRNNQTDGLFVYYLLIMTFLK